MDTNLIPSTNDRGEPAALDEYNGFELYPMPFFARLPANVPAALAAWYERALGFGVVFAGPVIHLRRRKYQDLLIVPAGAGDPAPEGGPVISFDADGEVDELARRAGAMPPLGRSSVEPPRDTPWNTRELAITDPAGHRLVFTSRRATPDAEAQERWRALFEAGRR